MRVRIVGSGLIGTSIGLASRAQFWQVVMIDSELENARLAQDLVGDPFEGEPDLVVLALPTSRMALVANMEFQMNPKTIFMDVGSVKTNPQVEIDSIPGLARRFCGTHPIAGREIGGPAAARADLFDGRPWIYTPSKATDPDVLEKVQMVIATFGAIPIQMEVAEHDRAVALLSHLPQISSSLLAAQIVGARPEWLSLAGQGLRDSTRIARSDPKLWREILSMNRAEIRPLLVALSEELLELIADFDDEDSIERFIAKGRAGIEAIPGKHGGKAREYSYLPIVIEDKAGQLGSLFQECAHAQVNIEDLSIEHSPGQFTGLITLALSKSDGEKLSTHLIHKGWKVHALR